MKILHYKIVIEKEGRAYGAYLPDLTGCVATGSSLREVKRRILKAVEDHISEMILNGYPLPHPRSGQIYKNSNIVEIARIVIDIDCLFAKTQKISA
ncbi:MAG TPA: type II toxin-antitoxin system HicB family antitoxin [bacterium]